MKMFALVPLTLAIAVHAQSTPIMEFPSDAAVMTPDSLNGAVSGKIYTAKIGDGSSWRFEFKPNGYYFIDTSRGYRDTGQWRVEESKLCLSPSKTKASCNEIRGRDSTLFLKRDSGEVVPLTAS